MLYIVATPIGNLSEITYRAVETLREADAVLCEDTRRTAVLLNRYEIKKPLISYQKFNERAKCEEVISRLKAGENLALVSDAGMPVISDPGSVLIGELIKENLDYTVVSGPCALVNAVVLSGLDATAFCMAGFLPEKKSDRIRHAERFKDFTGTVIFYSAPHDVRKDLDFLYSVFGRRKVAIVREISKIHEEVIRGNLGDVPEFTERGEFVVCVEGASEKPDDFSDLSIPDHVEKYIAEGLDKKDAVKRVAEERKIPKSQCYNEYEKHLRDGNKR